MIFKKLWRFIVGLFRPKSKSAGRVVIGPRKRFTDFRGQRDRKAARTRRAKKAAARMRVDNKRRGATK